MPQYYETTINNLSRFETQSQKKGFIGDATDYAFKRHSLELLKNIKEDFKGFNINELLKRTKKLEKNLQISLEQNAKLKRDLDFYIKEYPEQMKQLEKNK